MSKKPKLKLVTSPTTNPGAPPLTLGEPGAKLWRSILNEYQITDIAGLAMLEQICAAVDRGAQCRAAIEHDGPIIMTAHGPKEHPLLKSELACRSFVVRTLDRLGLNQEPLKTVGRPSTFACWTPPHD